ncbi:hypothetical protein HMPREF1570_3938 [Klebsiella oxytoca KA-2]|nr:hypothetical protein HMPREF1570_3938 [Klebsiella oxytoca KA-2]
MLIEDFLQSSGYQKRWLSIFIMRNLNIMKADFIVKPITYCFYN